MTTLIGVAIGAVIGPLVVKVFEWLLDRRRNLARTVQIEKATDRDDLKLLLTEWKELHTERMEAAEQRSANQLENWLWRIRHCVTGDPVCLLVVAEVEGEIARLRLERLP